MLRFGRADLEIAPSPQAVAERGAELFFEAASAARDKFSFALSGGSTPRLFHEVIAARYRDALDWSKIHLLFSDDRAVSPDHKDSNYRMAYETLISRVPIPAENVHRVAAEDADHVRAAAEYDRTVARVLGSELAVDFLVLGMGEDGHTASLFPGMKLESPGFVIPAEAPPTSPIARRVTFSYSAIARARRVIALITGASKANRLREVLLEQGELPMQRVLRERTGTTTLIVDQAAAASIAAAS